MAIRQHRTKSDGSRRILSRRKLAMIFAAMFAFGAATPAAAHAANPGAASAWSFGEVFTFLFVTLGPLNVIGPFLTMTQPQSAAFRRRVALEAFVIAMIGLLVVATVGAATLHAWGVSNGALLLTGGAILSLVALRPILAGYASSGVPSQPSKIAATPERAAELAFSPLAFPTIITPYGLALLVLLFTLYPISSGGLQILGTAVLVLALDLVVMLCANLVAKIPRINPALNILGCVMNVLLVALGAQAVTDGIRLIAEQRF